MARTKLLLGIGPGGGTRHSVSRKKLISSARLGVDLAQGVAERHSNPNFQLTSKPSPELFWAQPRDIAGLEVSSNQMQIIPSMRGSVANEVSPILRIHVWR
jgi:hypothetical protein